MRCRGAARAFDRGLLIFSQKQTASFRNAYLAVQRVFGWNERLLKKAMQVHYASLSILERMGLSRITGKM